MAEELEAEDLLRILVREFRRLKSMGQNLWNRLSSQQRRRAGIERGILQDRWGPDRNPDVDVRDRTAQLERDAARAEDQVRDLQGQNENLRGDVDRQREQNRDLDAERNNDRDGDGIDDRDIRELSDVDNDRIPDQREHNVQSDQQNDTNNAVDGADRQRDDQAWADEDKRKREEQGSEKDREDGVDPVTAGAAAGAAAEAADLAGERDGEKAEDRLDDAEADRESTVDADNAVDDPSAEADNELQTEPAADREDVNPYVSEEGALDPNDRLNENNLDQDGQQTDPTLDADGEPTVDADNALEDSSVDADNVVEDPSAEADNVRQTEPVAEQDGVSPYVSDGENLQQNGTDLGQDSAEQDPSLDGSNPQTDVDQSAGQSNERVVEWDTERDGSHVELDADQEWDGTVYQTGENGPSLTVNGGEQGQEQFAPDVEGQEQGGPQSAEGVNIDRVEGQTFTVGQNGVQFADQNEATADAESGQQVDAQQVEAPQADTQQVDAQQVEAPQADAQQVQASGQGVEAGQDGAQPPQPKGPNTQQIANASQNAVDEAAGLGQEDGQSPGSQTEGPSTSQAQGTQWRPPEQAAEDPAIAEAKGQQNGRSSGPGPELPPNEKATFDNVRTDQTPLSSVKVEGGSVATSERPGTPAAQRGQDRDRGGRGNDGRGDDGGRGR